MLRGYLEGYYGRLFDWTERAAIVTTLHSLGLNAYVYAPKEDVRHRLHWRQPYDDAWRMDFKRFCADARARHVNVIAGVAPGIDFAFASLEGGCDLDLATDKLARLRDDGATHLMLLMDDIDADFAVRNPDMASEGEAHARLANRLGERLDVALIVVPRIYATELARDAPAYLNDFARTLDVQHAVSGCGSDIVSRVVQSGDLILAPDDNTRRTILWDNLYANDYCPRRLFVGPWSGRDDDLHDVWLNGTGLLATDSLLLSLMQAGMQRRPMHEVFREHGVPEVFDHIAPAFCHPVTNDRLDEPVETLEPTDEILAAIDELLWRWKTPLSREWYPYLMGLRHDLLLSANALPSDRIRKTQTPGLALRLLSADDGSTRARRPVR